jgi:hypothetical protein
MSARTRRIVTVLVLVGLIGSVLVAAVASL